MMEQDKTVMEDYKDMMDKRTITVKELAVLLGVSEPMARKITYREGFPKIYFGRNIKVIVSRLDEWLENNLGARF